MGDVKSSNRRDWFAELHRAAAILPAHDAPALAEACEWARSELLDMADELGTARRALRYERKAARNVARSATRMDSPAPVAGPARHEEN